ncbi:GNAT family N-acetyltransferase [Veronia pacifica]|uniref:N-acetyltransferase domain-containing protein n=1 Tax=Veronia pacifica TaxID=1080227 RepID=A0A1C3EKY0_9GAMM|nr:GNAT family N-acetyltransferase [Veronia pacifica]ODA33889.1 hypothetical protein A8L45_08685 [Veronia pacifica]
MISIREAIPSDAAEIADIKVSSWHKTYRGLVCDNFLASVEINKTTAFWQQLLQQPNHVFVATLDDKVIGFVHCCQSRDPANSDDNVGEITAIYLSPDHERKGAGSALIQHTEQQLRDQGYGSVTLWALKDNIGAHQFYLRSGYLPDGEEGYRKVLKATAARYRKEL